MLSYNEILKIGSREFSNLKPLKVALVGDSATQHLTKATRAFAKQYGLALDLYEGDYDLIVPLVSDPGSPLYAFSPEAVILLFCSEKLCARFYQHPLSDRAHFAQTELAKISGFFDSLQSRLPSASVLINNFVEIDDTIFGQYGSKHPSSFLYQLRTLNFGLMELASKYSGLGLIDLVSIQNQLGRPTFHDPRLYINATMSNSLEAVAWIARSLCDLLGARSGRFKKCVILDLDNTLWGGVIGDDGLERIEIGDLGGGKAFTLFQQWLKELQRRGILLAVCSKNEDRVAREPFLEHSEMVLKLEDMAVFVANWESKVDNIRLIQSQLNIGFDSMVFLDDNAYERNLVRTHLPEITVPELPEDSTEYLSFLQSLNLFETPGVSEADVTRTRQIQEKIQTDSLRTQFCSEAEFLASLHMVLGISGFTKFNTPRVAQLTQRSNQYNLRTIRYSEEEVRRLASDPGVLCLALSLKDNLADHGLISVLVAEIGVEELFIQNWLMSCRVLRRGVEQAALNYLVTRAQELGLRRIVGEFLPSPKNDLVKDHYSKLGFQKSPEGRFVLAVDSFSLLETFITPETSHD